MSDDWKQIQDDLRAGKYGAWSDIRRSISERWSAENPGMGISSSDFNHIAYGMVKSGELTRVTS